jgi:hypothetical protein
MAVLVGVSGPYPADTAGGDLVLMGQWPVFQGTIIKKVHYFIIFGAYDYFL